MLKATESMCSTQWSQAATPKYWHVSLSFTGFMSRNTADKTNSQYRPLLTSAQTDRRNDSFKLPSALTETTDLQRVWRNVTGHHQCQYHVCLGGNGSDRRTTQWLKERRWWERQMEGLESRHCTCTTDCHQQLRELLTQPKNMSKDSQPQSSCGKERLTSARSCDTQSSLSDNWQTVSILCNKLYLHT